jgi:hypothetical protein
MGGPARKVAYVDERLVDVVGLNELDSYRA